MEQMLYPFNYIEFSHYIYSRDYYTLITDEETKRRDVSGFSKIIWADRWKPGTLVHVCPTIPFQNNAQRQNHNVRFYSQTQQNMPVITTHRFPCLPNYSAILLPRFFVLFLFFAFSCHFAC